MWKLSLTLFFIVVSTSSIASDVQFKNYFHEIRTTSGAITFVKETKCTEETARHSVCIYDTYFCQEKCEGKLILCLEHFSGIKRNAFQPNNFTQLTLRSIEAENCSRKMIDLIPGSFNGTSSVRELWLDCAEFPSTPNLFKDFVSLNQLSLSRMDFKNLPDHFHSEFPKLKSLMLVEVIITSITSDTFSNINLNLTRLILDTNNMTVVEGKSFQKFHNLKSIVIENNPLTDLPPDMFDGLDALEVITLGHNEITALRGTIFSHLPRLKTLFLSNNKISEIGNGTFCDLGLDWLDLSHNELEYLPVGVFKNLPNLRVLSLHNNKISTVGTGVFEGLSPRTNLHLTQNNIDHIEPFAFQGLNIRSIRLNNNNLKVLQPDTFNGLNLTDALNLDFNSITKTKKAFRNLTVPLITLRCNKLTKDKIFEDKARVQFKKMVLDDSQC